MTSFDSPRSGVAVALRALDAASASTAEHMGEGTTLVRAAPDTSGSPGNSVGSIENGTTSVPSLGSLRLLWDHREVDPGLSPSRLPDGAHHLVSTLEYGSQAPSNLTSSASLLSPSRRGLSPTLISEDADLLSTVERSLAELTRDFVSRPNDRVALLKVCAALLGEGQVEEVIGALEDCANADGLPDHDLAELSFRIAKGCTDAHARELCRLALGRDPVHAAALSLFEQLADAPWTDELCARYELFLEHAPLHGVAPEMCAVVKSKLVTKS